MILGAEELLKRVEKEKIVQGLSERELVNPEGAGFDLRVGEVHKITGSGFLGIEERNTAKAELVHQYKEGKPEVVKLEPGEYRLISTVETVKMPEDLMAQIFSRSTLFRSGVQLLSGKVGPGYEGKLTFGLRNLGKEPFSFELGARVAFIAFSEVRGCSNGSRGQWKGGRVSADTRERQV